MLDPTAHRAPLAAWYGRRQRRVPWRDEPTPYRVWVSEVMLQQTQVDTVVPYFERFVGRLPDVWALAAADEQEVLGLWAGLGYYRRCRGLQAAARVVVERFAGRLPERPEELLQLPGIGPYTAGAIASIAFGQAVPALDGNVLRVLARLTAEPRAVDAGVGRRALEAVATALVDPADPSTHNQALIELGALVCTPRQPLCHACPLRTACAARTEGDPHRYPIRRPRRAPKPVTGVCGLVTGDGGEALLVRRPEGVLLGGLWELPGGELPARTPRAEGLRQLLAERLGVSIRVGARLASVEHVFTHRRLTLEAYRVHDAAAPFGLTFYTAWRWIASDEPCPVPLSRLTEKVLTALGHPDGR